MAFAKAYREEITLAYYCFNLALTIAFFIFGTMYLRHRDRRDQRRKEWRQFTETIRSEYSKLKAANILYNISKVKDTFGNIPIHTEITGLDVLRHMIDSDFKRFKTTELDALCEDLSSIFQLLNSCASLILLGAVPNNIRSELGKLVTKLGEITLPFYKGEERATILKCLKHFSSGHGRATVETERKVREIDTGLEEVVPYIQCLRFGGPTTSFFSQLMEVTEETGKHYIGCSKLRFHVSVQNPVAEPRLNFLTKLQEDLEEEIYSTDFARELRERLTNRLYTDEVGSDSDELVLMQTLHEVRVYIHIILTEERKALGEKINQNIDILMEMCERVTKIRPNEVIVRSICERFMSDLSVLKKNMHPYHKSESFRLQLQELYETFCDELIIRENAGPSFHSSTDRTTTENYQYESCV